MLDSGSLLLPPAERALGREPLVEPPHSFEQERLGRFVDHALLRLEARIELELAVRELEHLVERVYPLNRPPLRVHDRARIEVDFSRVVAIPNLQVAGLAAMEEDLDHVRQPHLAQRAAHAAHLPRLRRAPDVVEARLE